LGVRVNKAMKKFVQLMFLVTSCAFGQYRDFASTGYSAGAAEYLKRPVSAKSAALSGSVVAWRENLAGTQFNPAIYDAVPAGSLQFDGSYSFLTLDRKHAGAEMAGTLGSYLAYGLSFITYGVGNIDARNDYGDSLGLFSDMENALSVSVAGRFLWNISAGASVRYLYAGMHKDKNADPSLDLGEQANGIGVDIGATWEPLEYLCAGLSVQNIGSKLWWSTGIREDVLTSVRLGVAGLFLKKSLIAEIDILKTLQQPIQLCGGIQYTLFDIVSFRGGISADADYENIHMRSPDYSLGLGVRYSFFGFDYALIIPDSDLGLSHKLSLAISLKNPFAF
jgi:hypothetical protein